MGIQSFDHSDEKEVIVIGQLLDKQPCPESGSTHYGLVMKYKLISVVEGGFAEADSNGNLFVVHGAPELPRYVYYKVSTSIDCCCCSGLLVVFHTGSTYCNAARNCIQLVFLTVWFCLVCVCVALWYIEWV
jgi:hypothetical protein